MYTFPYHRTSYHYKITEKNYIYLTNKCTYTNLTINCVPSYCSTLPVTASTEYRIPFFFYFCSLFAVCFCCCCCYIWVYSVAHKNRNEKWKDPCRIACIIVHFRFITAPFSNSNHFSDLVCDVSVSECQCAFSFAMSPLFFVFCHIIWIRIYIEKCIYRNICTNVLTIHFEKYQPNEEKKRSKTATTQSRALF